MGRLFIANVTRQRQIISYRMDIDKEGQFSERLRTNGLRQETIESGKQSPIGGEMHPNQIETIIDQLTPYGLVADTDIPNNLPRGVITYVFGIDKPVSPRALEYAVAHNRGVKLEEGAVRRERAAIAANEALAQQIGTAPPEFDVEFEQEEVSELDESPVAVGYHVSKDKPRGKAA